jgi:hypothetical protein
MAKKMFCKGSKGGEKDKFLYKAVKIQSPDVDPARQQVDIS